MRIRILEAAKQEFAAHGLAGARVDRIAVNADANKRMLYYHIGNKEDLYLAVLEAAYDKIRSEERGLDLEHLDPPDAIERLIDFTWNYFIRNPEFLALLNNENMAKARHLKRSTKVKSMHSPFVEMIRTVVRAGVQGGDFRVAVDRERSVAEAKGLSGVSKALNAAWVRPFLFLIFIVVAWDLTIRLFRIPPYQIPAPGDVVAVLYTDWPELLRQSWPTTYATICGFLLSAVLGIPVAMLIAGSKTMESYVYPLLVFSQSVPKIAIAPLFVVWFGFGIIPKVISAFLLGFFPVVVSAVQGFESVG